MGLPPNTTLSESVANGNLTGTASWNGVLLGIDVANTSLVPVSGDAELTVNLDTFDAEANFDNLTVHEHGATTSRAFRAPTLNYALSIDGNGFADADGRVEGAFYGPEHEEMAGILDDRRTEVNLIAGFGGNRTE